jgi:hypothetical protein
MPVASSASARRSTAAFHASKSWNVRTCVIADAQVALFSRRREGAMRQAQGVAMRQAIYDNEYVESGQDPCAFHSGAG